MRRLYMLLVIAMVLCSLSSCARVGATVEPDSDGAQIDRIKASIYQIYEAINHQDTELLAGYFASDLVLHRSPYPDVVGLEAYEKLLERYFAAFPDSEFRVEKIIVEGNRASIQLSYQGTHTGTTPTLGLPPTGKQVASPGSAILLFANGRIVEQWDYWDELGFYQQLGYALKDESSEKIIKMISVDTRLTIEDLIAAYSFGYDEMEWDLYSSIWDDDAVLASSLGERQGKEKIVASARQWREHLQAQGIQTRHYQTNTLLTLVDEENIRGRTMFHVAWQRQGEKEPALTHTGIYIDEFRLSERGWLLVRRQIKIDHD